MPADASAVLDALGEILAGDPSEPDVDLVLVSAQSRRRSNIYVVGTRGGGAPRWVVKVPHTTVSQVDLAPPRSPEAQLIAVGRLAQHLEHSGTRFAAPRPVALLPDGSGFVMEFAAGRHLTSAIGVVALLSPGSLLRGAATAADLLRDVHGVGEKEDVLVPLAELHAETCRKATDALRLAGLPEERAVVPWPAEIARSTVVRRRHVLLHGDFAPENLVFSADQVYCLDADLLDRGPEDLDVVRFLTMLYDAPFFITGSGVRVVSRLRVRTGAAFLRAYYGDVVPVVTWWALIEGIASRWAMRHADCVARQPAFTSTRLALLDRHFSSILDELAVAARQSGGVVSEPELG